MWYDSDPLPCAVHDQGTCSVTLLSFVTSLFKSIRALLLHSNPYCKINKNNSNNLLKFRFNKSVEILNFSWRFFLI